MSRSEVRFRLLKGIKTRLLQLRLSFNQSPMNNADFLEHFDVINPHLTEVAREFERTNFDVAKACLVRYYKNRNWPNFFFNTDQAANIATSLNGNAKTKIIDQANAILRHNFELLSLKVDFSSGINWHLDPTTGKQWPKIFRGAIRYDSRKYSKDVKYVWELNRHKHLVTLGKAYILTGDEKYAKEVLRQFKDWIEDNPAEFGVNWADNLEVAMRSIAWLWSYNFLKHSPTLDEDTHLTILKSIYQHSKHICSELSIYTCANNHLIGEATALWMIGLLFPEFKESERWRIIGVRILERELGRQVHPDGVHAEQGIGYHRFVLDFYTQFVVLAKKNDIDTPDDMMQKIERMFEFILALVDRNGRVPMFGDADDARGTPVADGEFWDFRDSLSTGAVLFNRSDMKAAAGQFHETSLWQLGLAGKEKFDSIPKNSKPMSSKAFTEGGYYIMRSGQGTEDIKLVFDCGRLGLPPRFGHGHADMLSLTLSAFGTEMLVDPGTFGYMCAGDTKNYFRGTKAHNTVVVDHLDQADPYGTARWLNIPETRLHHWASTHSFDIVDGSHNGYERLRDPITHRRIVFFVKPQYWIVSDFLLGSGHHTYEQCFHFPPFPTFLDPESKIAVTRSHKDQNLAIIPAHPTTISAKIRKGSNSPFEGWISYSYGSKESCPILKYTIESQAPVSYQTLIYPFSGHDIPALHLTTLEVEEMPNSNLTMGLKIETNRFTDYFIASCAQAESRAWDDYQSDADLIYLRKGLKGQSKVFLLNGSFLSIEDNFFFKRKKRVPFAELDLDDLGVDT